MKTFMTLLLGFILGIGVLWLIGEVDESRMGNNLEEAGDRISEGAERVGREVSDAVKSIDTEKIKREAKEIGDAVAENSKDAAITAKVKTALAADDEVSALDIDVDTENGVVTLSGEVETSAELQQAEAIAQSVEGVRAVHLALQVIPES